VKPVYVAKDLDGFDEAERLGRPGEYPYTRGVQPTMYRGRLWTMRQYAGFGSAEATNQRFKFLLEAGQTGLSCAFDLPTQMGYDADHARSEGEVGKVGVAISSLDDMRLLFADLPLDEVTTSMTINSTASTLLLLYQLVGEEQGVRADQLRGTIQNDILKEYVARGTYIYPPRPSMRLVVDTFSYCAQEMPNWNTISISGYHIREAGSTAVQEVAFTLANGIAYVEAALAAGLALDDFAPRLSFFFNAHNNLFEEVAKYRAARRLWATIMRERFGAKDPKSMMLRFHTQTGGSTLTAQQPENNIVRVTIQALAAALGGTQSLHTNGFDEALGLPTERRREAGPSYPAGARLRVRRRRHRRPVGRLVLRRVADQRGRTPGARLHRGHRRPGRGGRRDRVALHARRDRRGGLRVRARRRPWRQGRRRGQSFHRGRVHQGRRVPRRRGPAARAGRPGLGTEELARR
jgi:methylmalonyl-CoA mutase N-terminal domain/subunit